MRVSDEKFQEALQLLSTRNVVFQHLIPGAWCSDCSLAFNDALAILNDEDGEDLVDQMDDVLEKLEDMGANIIWEKGVDGEGQE